MRLIIFQQHLAERRANPDQPAATEVVGLTTQDLRLINKLIKLFSHQGPNPALNFPRLGKPRTDKDVFTHVMAFMELAAATVDSRMSRAHRRAANTLANLRLPYDQDRFLVAAWIECVRYTKDSLYLEPNRLVQNIRRLIANRQRDVVMLAFGSIERLLPKAYNTANEILGLIVHGAGIDELRMTDEELARAKQLKKRIKVLTERNRT